MIETIRNAWRLPELRRRILFTLLVLLIYRLGSAILVPYINYEELRSIISQNSLFGLINVISGNNFSRFSIFAMGISPYVNASIVMQLLTIAIPYLENLNKEGEKGRKAIAAYTRYLSVALAIVQALGMVLGFTQLLTIRSTLVVAMVTSVICGGTSLLMWMGEQITDRGLGNGVSVIIFAGIVSGIPTTIVQTYNGIRIGSYAVYIVAFILAFMFFSIVGVIAIQEGTRKIPVQYAKRVVGRKVYGGRNTHLPLKVNQSGVIPIIFAQTLTLFPSQMASFFPNNKFLANLSNSMDMTKPWTIAFYMLLIVAFTFFYTLVSFDPQEVAENIQQNGGFIPGIRPGKPTVAYMQRILNRLTLSGAIFLAIIAILPTIVSAVMKTNDLQFTGTSTLIVVGVALEMIQQLEQHLIMRNYKGFL
ncbi:MAG: preprotein translocase subunit SecY [Eubacteriaceae bacterium]|nr:preprotein translocase subunit SecY [Eubacteriaceae bacterium]